MHTATLGPFCIRFLQWEWYALILPLLQSLLNPVSSLNGIFLGEFAVLSPSLESLKCFLSRGYDHILFGVEYHLFFSFETETSLTYSTARCSSQLRTFLTQPPTVSSCSHYVCYWGSNLGLVHARETLPTEALVIISSNKMVNSL